MMQTLKSIILYSADNIFEEFVPDISHNFHVWLSLTIGDGDQAGGSDYSIGICTPTWLDHHIQNSGPLPGRHLLIVNRFDAKEIRASIEKIISQSERMTTAETNAFLARSFAWEFEDYQP